MRRPSACEPSAGVDHERVAAGAPLGWRTTNRGQTHLANALRLLVIQTAGEVAVGGAVTGVLVATTDLGLSGALFVAAVLVAVVGVVWSVGGPKRALPGSLGIDRLDDPVGISRVPVGTSQADAVLVVSSVLAGLLLAALAVVAAG
jgi:hypothetical protein